MAGESAVRVIFLGDSSSAVRSVSRLESAFGGLGRTAKLVTGAVGIAMVGALAGATKAAIDFDRSMRNVNSIAKLSEAQFQSLSKQVLALGASTGQTPKVLADGLYDVVSSGFKANDAIKILSVSAKAATAGMTDTATASKAVVAVLNAYGLSADKARNVSSLLFTEVNKGVNTFEELATNIGDTAPLAAALKIPFSDVSAGLALITLHGTSMAEAATQMSRVMADLLKPSKGLSTELHKLGYENGQAAISAHGFIPLIAQLSKEAGGSAAKTADWFQNIRSLRGMLNLTGPNLKKFNEFAEQMRLSFQRGGADVAAFNEQAKSISVQWAMAKSALIAAAIPIGQLLFPALIKATQGISYLANAINQHMPQIKRVTNEATRAIADGWSRYGVPAMRVAGQIARQTAAYFTAHWPQIRSTVHSVLGAVRAFGSYIVSQWPQIRATAIVVGRAIQQGMAVAKQAIQALAPVLRALAPILKAAFSAGLAIIRAFAVVAATSLRLTAAEINIVKAVVRPLGGAFSAAFAVAAGAVKAAGSVITGILSAINAAINGTISALHALSSAVGAVKSLPGKIGHGIGSIIHRAEGGFIPGSAGSPVPIIAHAGEVVLNQAQQAAFGGAAFFQRMFGFTGAEGPAFASGGIVGNKSFLGKKPGPTPHKGRGHSSHTKAVPPWASKQIGGVLRHLRRLDDDKSFLDQEYSNLSTRFSILDDDQTFMNTVPDPADPNNTIEVVNTAFVAQRSAELRDLIAERQKLYDKMEEQKKALVAAVKMLRKAIGQLLRNLRSNETGIRHDAEQLTKLSRELAKEKTKKKPNAGRVRSLEASIKGVRADMTSRGQAKNNINTARATWGQQIADWGHDLRFLPLDEGGVLNDILDLNQQLGYLGSADLIKKHYGGGGGGGGGGAAAGAPSPNLEGLGAAIGALQTGIIGSFQKGTLYVPQTGLAMVHTGETITPAGHGSSDYSQAPVQVLVHVTVEDGAVDASKIKAIAVQASDAIALAQGNSTSQRIRSNRF